MSATTLTPNSALGDLPMLSEPPHARRSRLHQAWYRSEVLGLNRWGSTPQGRPLGSILDPQSADAGKNFTSTKSRDMFAQRRLEGWGVDPVRMTSHMTSSQALLVNLLGPLANRPAWLIATLATALQRPDLRDLLEWKVEFAPRARAQYLGDMTRVDAYFVVSTSKAVESIVLELKYTDRFSSRRLALADNPRYKQLAASSGLWADPFAAFGDGETSQLLRCHALGSRTLEVEHGSTTTTLLLVSHPTDPAAADVFRRYQTHLETPESAAHLGLDRLLLAARASANSAETREIDDLETRYLKQELSEIHWLRQLSARRARTRGRPARGPDGH